MHSGAKMEKKRYEYVVVGHNSTYFVKNTSNSKHKDTEDDIVRMLDFLIDNIFICPSFDGRIMVWRCPSVRPSVRSVVHNPCGQDIPRTIWPRMLKLSVYT